MSNSFTCPKNLIFCFKGNAMSSFNSKHLIVMFCKEFYAIASFIFFSVESKVYFAFFKLV